MWYIPAITCTFIMLQYRANGFYTTNMYTHKISKLRVWAARVHLPLIYVQTDGRAFEKCCTQREVYAQYIIIMYLVARDRNIEWTAEYILKFYYFIINFIITVTSDSSIVHSAVVVIAMRDLTSAILQALHFAAVRVRLSHHYCFSASMRALVAVAESD